MIKQYLTLFISVSLLSLSSCVAIWTETKGTFNQPTFGYKIQTPDGWYQKKKKKTLSLTRDGCELECISIALWDWGDTLAFTGTKLKKDLLHHEIPQLLLDNFCSLSFAFDMQIVSQKLFMIDSITCSNTEFTYIRSDGVRMKNNLVYCPCNKKFYTILYSAIDKYYYSKYQNQFKDLLSSLEFGKLRKAIHR